MSHVRMVSLSADHQSLFLCVSLVGGSEDQHGEVHHRPREATLHFCDVAARRVAVSCNRLPLDLIDEEEHEQVVNVTPKADCHPVEQERLRREAV